MEKVIPLHSPIQFVKFEAINPMISQCTVKILYAGKNRNYSYISKETAEQMAKSLPNTPIVGEYSYSKEDFLGHADYVEDSDGNLQAGKRTMPIGVVPSDAKVWWENFTDSDGVEREYMCSYAYIWTGRYPESKRIIEKGNNQSMELDPSKIQGQWSKLDKGGPEYFVIKEACFSALCVLGEDVEPCFEGAQFNPILYSLLKTQGEKEKFDSEMKELIEELRFALSDYKKEKITDFPNNGDNKEISLRNSQWELFDPKFAANLKENHPEIWRLGGNIRGNSQYRKLTSALGKSASELNGTQKNAIELREAWVARHHKDFRIAGVIAQVKWLAVGSKGEKYMKDLIREEIKKKEARKANHGLADGLQRKMQEALIKLDALANRFETKEDQDAADALDLIISDLDKILGSMDEGAPIQSDPNDQSLPIYQHKKEDNSLTRDLTDFEAAAPSDDTGEDNKDQYKAPVEEEKEDGKEEEKAQETQDSYDAKEGSPAEEEKETLKEEEKEGDEEPKTYGDNIGEAIKAIEALLAKVKGAAKAEQAPAEESSYEEKAPEEAMQNELEQYKKENEELKMELASLNAFKEAIHLKEKESMMEKFNMLRQDFLEKVKANLSSYSLEDLESVLSVEAVRSGAFFEKQAPTISYSLESQNQDAIPAWVAALENLKK